jgi:hypothetical protein
MLSLAAMLWYVDLIGMLCKPVAVYMPIFYYDKLYNPVINDYSNSRLYYMLLRLPVV